MFLFGEKKVQHHVLNFFAEGMIYRPMMHCERQQWKNYLFKVFDHKYRNNIRHANV